MKYPESVLFKIKKKHTSMGIAWTILNLFQFEWKSLFSFRDNLGHMFDSWYVDWYMVYWQASG